MSFCPVEVVTSVLFTYFNADILENSFSNVILINELDGFQRLLLLCFPVVLKFMLFTRAIQLHIYCVHNFFILF